MVATRPARLPLLRSENQLRRLAKLLLEPVTVLAYEEWDDAASGFVRQLRSSPFVELDLQHARNIVVAVSASL